MPTGKMRLQGHARIQEFSSGGGEGGGSRSVKQKSSAYFTEVKWSISKKSIIFQGSRGGQKFSRGCQTFSRGVQLLIPYINPYNL